VKMHINDASWKEIFHYTKDIIGWLAERDGVLALTLWRRWRKWRRKQQKRKRMR